MAAAIWAPVVVKIVCMGTGVCGVCGRDGLGVLGPRGVNGLADGFSTCGFFTTGVAPLVVVLLPVPPAAVAVALLVALATGVDLSDPVPVPPVVAVVGVLAIPVGVVLLLLLLAPTPILGAGDASGFGVACKGGGACCSIIAGEVITTGEVCGCCMLEGGTTVIT